MVAAYRYVMRVLIGGWRRSLQWVPMDAAAPATQRLSRRPLCVEAGLAGLAGRRRPAASAAASQLRHHCVDLRRLEERMRGGRRGVGGRAGLPGRDRSRHGWRHTSGQHPAAALATPPSSRPPRRSSQTRQPTNQLPGALTTSPSSISSSAGVCSGRMRCWSKMNLVVAGQAGGAGGAGERLARRCARQRTRPAPPLAAQPCIDTS